MYLLTWEREGGGYACMHDTAGVPAGNASDWQALWPTGHLTSGLSSLFGREIKSTVQSPVLPI